METGPTTGDAGGIAARQRHDEGGPADAARPCIQLDARDAMLAADEIRFGGANQTLLWNVFAACGMGSGAVGNTNADSDAIPSFASPHARNAAVRFRAVDDTGAEVAGARIFVGDYQARAVPVADTDTATALPDTAAMEPGRYTFLAQAPGHGMTRFTARVPGSDRTVTVRLPRNLASAANGATASGDGVDLGTLIDDDEGTTWAYLGAQAAPVTGKGVTVRLSGQGPQKVRRIQVSALLRPANAQDPGGDTQSQNRFTALRSFQVLACTATAAVDCSQAADYHRVYTSPADAFPAARPRPVAPNLTSATDGALPYVRGDASAAEEPVGERARRPRQPALGDELAQLLLGHDRQLDENRREPVEVRDREAGLRMRREHGLLLAEVLDTYAQDGTFRRGLVAEPLEVRLAEGAFPGEAPARHRPCPVAEARALGHLGKAHRDPRRVVDRRHTDTVLFAPATVVRTG
jgi:Fungalysin metallopeptidase (M36)